MQILIYSYHPKHDYLNILLKYLKKFSDVKIVRFRNLIKSLLNYNKKFIIHLQFPVKQYELSLIILLAKIRKIPIIWTPHDIKSLSEKRKYRFQKFFLNKVDKIIVLSNANKDSLIKDGIKRNKIEIIPLANLNFYSKYKIPKKRAREILGINKNKTVFLQFGPFRKYKGYHLSGKAYDHLPESKKERSELVFAGKKWNNDKPNDLNLKNINTNFLGNKYLTRREIGIVFSAADVILYPYLWITQSGSIFLALAFGKPVIASSLGGIPEVIENGKEGYLIKPITSEITKKMELFINNNNIVEKMGANALIRSKKDNWDNIAKIHCKLYKSFN